MHRSTNSRTKLRHLSACLAFACGQQAPTPSAHVVAQYTLPDKPLAAFFNVLVPKSISNDRGVLLGGVGSDLWHGANDALDEFWMLTDRGPNGQVKVDGATRRTFLAPQFAPLILHVKVSDGAIVIQRALTLIGKSGRPVTGLPNLAEHDEKPYAADAAGELAFNVNGIDTDGDSLAREWARRLPAAESEVDEEFADDLTIMLSFRRGLNVVGVATARPPTLPGVLLGVGGGSSFSGRLSGRSQRSTADRARVQGDSLRPVLGTPRFGPVRVPCEFDARGIAVVGPLSASDLELTALVHPFEAGATLPQERGTTRVRLQFHIDPRSNGDARDGQTYRALESAREH